MGVWWHALAFVTHERAKMSLKLGRNVTQAGPKCHTRAKMSHSHVIITPKIHMYPGGYCPTPVTPRIHRVLLGHRIRIWLTLANTSVKLAKNSATSIEYENWENISWPRQILRRNYMKFVFWICERAQLKARFLVQWNISNILYDDITL